MVQIEQDILSKNDRHARFNREFLAERGIFAVNLVSSPGSGKTTLLTESIQRLQPATAVTVIEGDQQTTHDADRIRATGARALQINTGKGCHLDASMVERALERLQPDDELGPVHRERRQSRVPGRLRSRRSAQDRRALGDRRRGQAAEVPGHVPRRLADAAEQGRPAALRHPSTSRAASSTRAASIRRSR